MTDTVTVVCSGIPFSLLLYENIKVNADPNQVGLIFGEVISREEQKATDTDHNVIIKHDSIFIKSIMPCTSKYYFYNSSGVIDEPKFRRLLGDNSENLIGWYILNRDSLKTNIGEKLTHHSLMKFSNYPEYFMTCVVKLSLTSNSSTYSSSQIFMRYNMTEFEKLPLKITNLSDPFYELKSSDPSSREISQFIKSNKIKDEEIKVQNVQAMLNKHILGLIEEVSSKELELFTLEQEIKELQEKKDKCLSSLEKNDNIKAKIGNSELQIFDEIKCKEEIEKQKDEVKGKEIEDQKFEVKCKEIEEQKDEVKCKEEIEEETFEVKYSEEIEKQKDEVKCNEETEEQKVGVCSKSFARPSSNEEILQPSSVKEGKECKRRLKRKKKKCDFKMDIDNKDIAVLDEEGINETAPKQTKKRRGKLNTKYSNNVEHLVPIENYTRKTRSNKKHDNETTLN